MSLDLQLQQAIAAHMQYLRDLGIFEFYRRSSPYQEVPDRAVVKSISRVTLAHPPIAEELVIPKTIALQPPVGSFVSPPSRAEALRAIQFEIGDCTRCALSA